jgi:pimeloyl-ACP methyl ester carboxylesterase
VIAFEQQGHGHTADVDRPFSFEQPAEDAVALLRHLHVTKADFFGYSNGVISRWRSCSGTLRSWSSCPAV